MNKLGGWWRLWIALSLIWVAIVTFLLLGSATRQDSASERASLAISISCSSYLYGSQVDWTRVPPETIEAAITTVATGKVPEPRPQPTPAPTPAESGWGPELHTAPDSVELLLIAKSAETDGEAKKFITACLDAKRHDYEQDVIRQHRTDLLLGFAAAVVPPVLVLLLAFLVFWVIAGFRKSRSSS